MPKRIAGALRLAGTLVAFLLTALAMAAQAGAVTYPTGFEERSVVGGLTGPVGVDWTPDGRMLIIEKDGRVRVQNPGAATSTVILDITPRVNQYHDRGLLGIAVDSSFATNHYIYLLYTYELNPLAQDNSGPMVSRLGRFVLNDDNTVGPETVLLGSYGSGVCQAPSNTHDCIPSEGFSHSIGSVRSAPDGSLFVGSGDAASYSVVDPQALNTYNEQTPRGKIMRIDRNGNGVPGHPFCAADTDLTHVCTKLWAKGFRNPYRFKLRPNGGLTVGDVGWNTREELELIDPSESGKSWGWPCYEGTIKTPGYQDRAECQAEYAKPAGTHTAPDYDYDHSGSSSILGGPQYGGNQYPAGYRGSVFFSDYSAGFVKRATINGQNQVTGVQNFATAWYGTDLDAGPDGNLVWVSFGDGSPGTGSVKTIVYSPGNSTPIASATADRTSGPAPLTVALDASGSVDPNGDTLTYDWDFGDGSAHSSAAKPTHAYAAGSYTARVTVSDGRGLSSSASVAINAGNSAPSVTIAAPTDGSSYTDRVAVPLSASASDPQDGTLPTSAVSWHIVLYHGTHSHPLTDVAGATGSFIPYDDHDSDAYYQVTATATDSGGLTASSTVKVYPRTIKLTLASSPAGAPISYSGLTAAAAPVVHTSAVGYRTTISAAASFTSGGKTYVFDKWSDAGARQHDITVAATDTTLAATYVEQVTTPASGLVGAWGFNEGTGTSALDSSGKGNAGVVAGGAAWTTAGRYGAALTFDGVNDWVTVPDSSSLDLTGPMTLEAWVKPRVNGKWDTVLMKEYGTFYSYALYATDEQGVPTGWARDAVAWGTSPLATAAWSHLAFTYDGTVTRLYVNGTLTSSTSQPFALPNTDGPLRIGGNGIWSGEFFDGQIDDVRVYNRPLAPAEVTTDMNTGVGGGTTPPPPPADTTPPTVALTAPAAGTVSGTVVVTASASDNVGVQSVQFKLGAQDLGTADTTAPYSYSWNTTGVANGTYALTAVARDAAGNTKTSTAVNVTVANTTPTPAGLVGAWSFDEGTGATIGDRSGKGNAGTISGASWTTAGRYGGALSFDGVNDWVTVPDANSLDLTGPLTLEAWVKPTVNGKWNTVLMKEYGTFYSYALYATDEQGVPTGWARDAVAWGTSPPSTTAWTHLAFTYDGTVARLYVNGVMTSSSSNVFVLPNTNGPLRIGGNGIWGEYFNGLIDDVRVYSRTLSAAEVQADMGTGVASVAQPAALVPAKARRAVDLSAPDVALAMRNPFAGPTKQGRHRRVVRSRTRKGRHAGAPARTKTCRVVIKRDREGRLRKSCRR